MIRWRGTAYRAHPLFILVMMMSVVTGYFVELITLFSIVIIHELGHVAAAKGFGWRITEVQLLPFGGVAVVEDQGRITPLEEIAVAIAGPAQNALMIGLAFTMQWTGIWGKQWADYFISANMIIGLFNLLPLLPLDGGRLMQSILSLMCSYHRTIVACASISILFSAVMIVMSLHLLSGEGIQLNLLIIGVFLLYSNWHEYRNIPYRFMRFLLHRKVKVSVLIEKGGIARPIIVNRHISILRILQLFKREQFHLIYIVNHNGTVKSVIPEQRIVFYYLAQKKPLSTVLEYSSQIAE